jgi:AraC-like DNA-binding protein
MVSGLVVRGILHAVECAGVTREQFLRAARLELDAAELQSARVPRSLVLRLCELAVEITGDPAFGLHWAERLTERTFVPVSHMITHGTSLRQAFELLARFYPLLSDEADYRIVEGGTKVTLFCVQFPGSQAMRRFGAEMATLGFWQLVRCFAPRAKPLCASFEHAAPAYRAEYTRLFGGTERFEQDFTGLVFDRRLMDATSAQRDDAVQEAMQSLSEQRLFSVTQGAPWAQRVRDYLLREGWPERIEMEHAAQALATSVRSLRRHLSAEGKSYGEIVNEVLSTVAKALLRAPGNSIRHVADEMGFADPSSFHRAFKRWTGTTPSAYRALLLDGQVSRRA